MPPTKASKPTGKKAILTPGAKSKTKNLACSRAMSEWKSTGHQSPEVSKILGMCRRSSGGKLNYTKQVGKDAPRTHVHTPKEAKVDLKAEREKAARIAADEAKLDAIAKEAHRISREKFGEEGQKFITQGGEHAKNMNKHPVGLAERVTADAAEKHIAHMTGGVRITGYKPGDVKYDAVWEEVGGSQSKIYRVKGAKGKTHYIEVKVKVTGEGQKLDLHKSSILKKAIQSRKENAEFHTIVIDMRDKHLDGKFAHLYSGHRYYYMRGTKSAPLSHFEKLDHPDTQIKEYMLMDESQIKNANARHSFLKLTDEQMKLLGEQGARSKASRDRHEGKFGVRRNELGLDKYGNPLKEKK